jgi:hypothetical protein
MTRLMMSVITLSALILAVASPREGARAQTPSGVAGTWTLVSVTLDKDGNKKDFFGPNPKGVQVFDGNGRFSIAVVRSDLPKFASPNREQATADESQKVVHGSIAYFGTYTVNEADKSLTFQIEGATFPNWTGASQKRLYAVSGDMLTITNPTPSAGGGTATVVWKRAK